VATLGARNDRDVRENDASEAWKTHIAPVGRTRMAGQARGRTVPVMDDRRHVVIAGGGPAALEAALTLQRLAGSRVALTLVSASNAFVYRPLAVAEPFGLGSPQRFSLPQIAADRGLDFIHSALRGVDAAAHRAVTDHDPLAYDALLLALGAVAEEAVPGALTFGGEHDAAAIRTALEGLHAGAPLRVAFVASAETAWTLPIYELALMTARWARGAGLALEPWLVTHEPRALAVFGEQASSSVAGLLDEAGVRLWTGAFAEVVEDGRLWMSMEGGLPVDLAIALPRPVGRHVPGLPADEYGFVPVDSLGRVPGAHDVYAAGDMTTRPIKQGGLATQQADAAASAIAAWAGAPVQPQPYRPVLRAVLLTGATPRFLRHGRGEPEMPDSLAADEAPWWPPHKIAGRELAPYLNAHPELRMQLADH
jgi:sulfide:quinone oxidoreductase